MSGSDDSTGADGHTREGRPSRKVPDRAELGRLTWEFQWKRLGDSSRPFEVFAEARSGHEDPSENLGLSGETFPPSAKKPVAPTGGQEARGPMRGEKPEGAKNPALRSIARYFLMRAQLHTRRTS